MGGKGPDGTGPKAGEAGDAAAIPKSYVSHQPQVPSRPPTDRILQSPILKQRRIPVPISRLR
jgi:hypothetical protein